MKSFNGNCTHLLALLIALLIIGCSKSDNPTTPPTQTDPAKSKVAVDQGNQILIPKLDSMISSRSVDTSSSGFSSALSLYQQALTYDPNNLDAHFGYATTEVLTIMNDPDIRGLFAGNNFFAPLSLAFTRNLNTQSVLGSVLPATVWDGTQSTYVPTPLSFYSGFRKESATHPFSYYQDLVEAKVLPKLADAIAHFKVISQNSSFAMYIHGEDLGGGTGDSIRIDLTEVYLLLACVNYIDAVGSFVTAYNVDYNATDSLAVLHAWQTGSSFLALRANGSQRMKDTKTGILGMSQSIADGINYFISQSPHPGIDLIRYKPSDRDGLLSVVKGMDSLKTVLSNPYSVPAPSGAIRVNLASFFDNAIPDFKAKLPAYTVQVHRRYVYVYPGGSYVSSDFSATLTWVQTSFATWVIPDPKMNGFFPDLTDATFKSTFGITAGTWKPSIEFKL